MENSIPIRKRQRVGAKKKESKIGSARVHACKTSKTQKRCRNKRMREFWLGGRRARIFHLFDTMERRLSRMMKRQTGRRHIIDEAPIVGDQGTTFSRTRPHHHSNRIDQLVSGCSFTSFVSSSLHFRPHQSYQAEQLAFPLPCLSFPPPPSAIDSRAITRLRRMITIRTTFRMSF
ncbi:hypothetical protein BDZ85DRAFT_48800 [Elsinoe ampelina]|uniref:Uncharacterized protein n=1 Tax=Elsinoe ampelina TaxID=302913 RepID=A0A6A6GKN5_9PEZI|nr:hypothetical protein BDZ85DRAFT_48800 [Elsinoe ampelina]